MITVKKMGLFICALVWPFIGFSNSNLILPPDTVYFDIVLCEGETFEGIVYEESDYFTDVELGADGDTLSVLIYSIQVTDPVRTNVVTSICEYGVVEGYTAPGIYEDVFPSFDGCDSIRTLEVRPFEAFLPNIFSPNNDGVNDYLTLSASDLSEMKIKTFSVYSRSGERLITLSESVILGSNFLWDGKVNNRQVSSGTYAYYLEVTDASGESVCPIYGDVTVIR